MYGQIEKWSLWIDSDSQENINTGPIRLRVEKCENKTEVR